MIERAAGRAAIGVIAACGGLLAGCGASDTGAPATTPPAFDTITIDVSQGGTGSIVMYDVDNGANLMTSKTAIAVNQTPFHTEISKPHGPRDIKVRTVNFPGPAPISCTLRINGAVVAADTEKQPGGGVTCGYLGTP